MLARAGPVLGAARTGPGVFEHPPLARLLGHIATCGMRHSKDHKKIMTKLLRSFCLSQVKGQVTKGQIWPFLTFFYKNGHPTREPEELQRRGPAEKRTR